MASAAEPGPQPKSQHFVHRAYLEGFIDPETTKNSDGRLWVYIPGKSPFPQRPERVAKRSYYYCLGEKGQPRDFQVEKMLGKLEDAALPILLRLRGKNFKMSDDERLTFAGYVALAFTRVPTFERSINRIPNLVEAHHFEMFSKNERLLEQAAREESEATGKHVSADDFKKKLTAGSVEVVQTNRGWSIKTMFEHMLGLQEIIARMQWSFFLAPEGDSGFLTTDNPVARFDPDAHPRGGIGFVSSASAHCAFPISREVCLVAFHYPVPFIQKLNASRVRTFNKNNITRFDTQVYAPFKSDKVQEIVNWVANEKKTTGRVYFRKGRVVEE